MLWEKSPTAFALLPTVATEENIPQRCLSDVRKLKLVMCPLSTTSSLRSDALTGPERRRTGNQEHRGHRGKAQVRKTKEEATRGEDLGGNTPRGTCQTMCPPRELRERESQSRLHRYEILAGTEKDRRPRGDPRRAVKEYSRPAAGKCLTDSADLRPPAVLLKTVVYLIDDIAAAPQLHPWTEVYSFVFDRLRSVKQDMIIQRAHGLECVAILERAVRFHIYASYRLCGEPLRCFDPCINDTHLQENLSWLLECYAKEMEMYPNQEEFQALCLLYNLGSTPAMQHVRSLPAKLQKTPAISLAVSINQAFLERNPVRLFRLTQRLTFLQSCALHRHVMSSRGDLLQIYSHGYNSRNCGFPLDKLSQLLALDGSLTLQLCQAYGLKVTQDNLVVFSKATFTEPEQGRLQCALYHSTMAGKQKSLSIGSIIHGCA